MVRYILPVFFFWVGGQMGLAQSNLTEISKQNLVSLRSGLQTNSYSSGNLLTPAKSMLLTPKNLVNSTPKYAAEPLAAAPIPPAWRYRDLAFFCKLEVKMEKALKMPVKFRLGEVQYVEKMEGKLKSY